MEHFWPLFLFFLSTVDNNPVITTTVLCLEASNIYRIKVSYFHSHWLYLNWGTQDFVIGLSILFCPLQDSWSYPRRHSTHDIWSMIRYRIQTLFNLYGHYFSYNSWGTLGFGVDAWGFLVRKFGRVTLKSMSHRCQYILTWLLVSYSLCLWTVLVIEIWFCQYHCEVGGWFECGHQEPGW